MSGFRVPTLPVMLRMALRGLRAHRSRLVLTLTAITLSSAFVAASLIFRGGMERGFDSLYAKVGRGTDVVVRGPGGVPTDLAARIRDVPGVASVRADAEGTAAVVDRRGRPVSSPQGLPQRGVSWQDAYRLTAGTRPRGPRDVALDAATADRTGYRVGDRVPIVPAARGAAGPAAARGGSGARPVGARPAAVVFTLTGVFTLAGERATGVSSMSAFAPSAAPAVLGLPPGTTTRLAVRARPGTSAGTLRAAVARVLPDGVEAVTGRRYDAEAASAVRARMGPLPKMMLIFSCVSAFVGSFLILNTFAMLVARRTRELALLRAVGAGRGQVTALVLGEASAAGVAGSTLGLLAGAGIAAGLRALFAHAGSPLPPGGAPITGTAAVAAYGVGTLVTVIAAVPAARRASRVPPVAAMRGSAHAPARRWTLAGALTWTAGAAMTAIALAASGDVALFLMGLGAAALVSGTVLLLPFLSSLVMGALGRPVARLSGVAGVLGRRNALRDPRRSAATAAALVVGLALVGGVSVLSASIRATLVRDDPAKACGAGQFFDLIYVLLTLSLLMAALGIANTLTLAVAERTRELGLLRAVGLDRRATRRMIRVEAALVAAFGALLGLLLGAGYAIVIKYAAGGGIAVLRVPVGELAAEALAAVGIGVLAASPPAWRAARLDVLDAIRDE
ncbi:ABC transporter permease [Actinomadura rupiterrae]|uniref:ABC transporter permease n=1 Tax=Actinomadura rupiterrae TaxID=559627 RepID=UPI0020A520EB|nr:ABC transporter permease [Actinomadura rupiterrae]MCP2341192.1 ABC-type lipoprotein release transport system permease subunit [Actinomadura rupiterrae]